MPEARDRHAGGVFGVSPFEVFGRHARPELPGERGREAVLACVEAGPDVIEHSYQERGFLLHRETRSNRGRTSIGRVDPPPIAQ
jgi:hypothetical protein